MPMQKFKPSASTVASATLGPAVAVIGFWILKVATGVEAPGEVQVSAGAIVSACIGYLFRGGQQRDVEDAPPPDGQ